MLGPRGAAEFLFFSIDFMVSISTKEAMLEGLSQETLPDSTPRKEGGGDAKGESKTVLAKKDRIDYKEKAGDRESSPLKGIKREDSKT